MLSCLIISCVLLYVFTRCPAKCHLEEFLQSSRARKHAQIHYVLSCKLRMVNCMYAIVDSRPIQQS